MKTSHTALKNLYSQRDAIELIKDQIPSVTKAQDDLCKYLNFWYDHIDSFSQFGPQKYRDVLTAMDKELNTITPIAKARQTRKDSTTENNSSNSTESNE